MLWRPRGCYGAGERGIEVALATKGLLGEVSLGCYGNKSLVVWRKPMGVGGVLGFWGAMCAMRVLGG